VEFGPHVKDLGGELADIRDFSLNSSFLDDPE
jgi:hypothetical protein